MATATSFGLLGAASRSLARTVPVTLWVPRILSPFLTWTFAFSPRMMRKLSGSPGAAEVVVMAGEGPVFRLCGCTDPATGRQYGSRCPRLAGSRHGNWYVRLELPAELDGRRRRIRRGG